MQPMSGKTPNLIAIETSTELASVALLSEGVWTQRESSGAQTHSATVLNLLQELLQQAGVSLAQCDALAFGSGPGSFTGVRTACGLAQGLAFGAGIPVAPVVTLLAMAEAARLAGAGDHILAVLDARMGEVYSAHYHFHDGLWQTISEPGLSTATEVVAYANAQFVLNDAMRVCGNGLLAYADDFQALTCIETYPQIMPHAESVGRLALIAMEQGTLVHARDAQPLYLRNKVALTTLERAALASANAAKNLADNTADITSDMTTASAVTDMNEIAR